MNRRQILASILALCACSFPSFAADSPWPAKSVRIVVPFPPGGSTDVLARLLAQRLSEKLGQPFVVENRAGAAGNIGTNAVATAPPDGYTLGLTTSGPLITNKLIYKDMPFDAEKNLTPIALIGEIPLVFVVNPSIPAKNLKEFIELARANPAKYSVGNSGRGMTGHLTVEFMKMNNRLDLLSVSYKGDAPAMTDLLGGTIQAISSPVTAFISNIQAGKLRGLAVTSKVRSPALPNVPTALEQGIDLEATIQYALVGPAGLSRAIVDKLNAEVNTIIQSPEGRAKLAEFGAVPGQGTPEALGTLMKTEGAKWKQVIETAKVKLD
ncbi:MAG: tripartite tricarboxylate transporter substrate binding protein [Betaproteobacteria bacterium]|nr:tripartite tricarboxylate transporter substrate binding protein [Betaproteobacteria bacterium]